MKKLLPTALCCVLVLGLWACSDTPVAPAQQPATEPLDGAGRADTAEAVFHLMKQAGLSKNFEVLYDLMSVSSQEQISKMKDQAVQVMESMTFSAKPEDLAKVEAAQQKQLTEIFGVSSVDELKAMSPRDFFVARTAKAASSDEAMAELEKSTLARCDYAEDNESATLVITNQEGKEEKIAVILEAGSWKFDFLRPLSGH